MTTISRKFGMKLRTIREQHNLSMRDLAEQLGYTSHMFVYLVETGKRKPSLDMIMKVSQIFGVSTDVLLNDDVDLPE